MKSDVDITSGKVERTLEIISILGSPLSCSSPLHARLEVPEGPGTLVLNRPVVVLNGVAVLIQILPKSCELKRDATIFISYLQCR